MYDTSAIQQRFGMTPYSRCSIMVMQASSNVNKMKKIPMTAISATINIVVRAPNVVSRKKYGNTGPVLGDHRLIMNQMNAM